MYTEIAISFVLKAVDNAFGTFKTLYLQKEKYFLGALFNAIGTFFYLVAIVQIAKSNNFYSIIAMCIATFIGTYLPGIAMKKSERDKLYIFEVTANSIDAGAKFADKVRNKNIAVKTYSSYDSDLNKVLSCKIYCTTKKESKYINGIIPQSFKYHVYVPVE